MTALVSTSNDGVAWKATGELRDLIEAGVFSPFTLESESVQRGAYRVRVTKLKEVRIKRLLRVTVESGDGARNFLVKIYRSKGILAVVKSLVRKSKAEMELTLARKTAERGIPTVVPLAAGKRQKEGGALESILVTSEIPDCVGLDRYLLGESGKSAGKLRERRDIIMEYGRLARRIHDAGVHQDDFDPNNTLVHTVPEGFELLLVDFERVEIVATLGRDARLWNLAKLNRIRGVTRTDRLRFIRAYAGAGNWKPWANGVLAAGLKVLRRDIKRAAKLCMRESRNIGVSTIDKADVVFRRKYAWRDDGWREGEISDAVSFALAKMRALIGGDRVVPIERSKQGPRGLAFALFKEYGEAEAAWQSANALLRADVPVALPVALVHLPGVPGYGAAYIYESVPDAATLGAMVERHGNAEGLLSPEHGGAAVKSLLDKLARSGIDCFKTAGGFGINERIWLAAKDGKIEALVRIPSALALRKPAAGASSHRVR
jgi:hypothetical protein